MAGETIISIVGNLTDAPNLSYTQNGIAVANFTIASTPRTFDKKTNDWRDGEALFMRCSAWRELGEHASQSFQKGTRVIAQGRLTQRSFETQQGEKRTVIELEVDEIGPSLKYATALVTRAQGAGAGRSSSPQQSAEPWGQPAQPVQQPQPDVWGAPNTSYGDSNAPF